MIWLTVDSVPSGCSTLTSPSGSSCCWRLAAGPEPREIQRRREKLLDVLKRPAQLRDRLPVFERHVRTWTGIRPAEHRQCPLFAMACRGPLAALT